MSEIESGSKAAAPNINSNEDSQKAKKSKKNRGKDKFSWLGLCVLIISVLLLIFWSRCAVKHLGTSYCSNVGQAFLYGLHIKTPDNNRNLLEFKDDKQQSLKRLKRIERMDLLISQCQFARDYLYGMGDDVSDLNKIVDKDENQGRESEENLIASVKFCGSKLEEHFKKIDVGLYEKFDKSGKLREEAHNFVVNGNLHEAVMKYEQACGLSEQY